MQNLPKIFSIFLLSLILPLVFSCSQSKVPIINRGSTIYKQSISNKNNTIISKNTNTGQKLSNYAVVLSGENIYRISKKYNIPLRDLINQNHLAPPYSIKVGDKINLPSNQYHKVVDGDTLYDISRKYGMNINNLIAINNLQKPYHIKVGESLKINISNTDDNKPSVAYSKNVEQEVTNQSKKLISHNLDEPKISEPSITNKNNHFIWPVKGAIISKFGPKAGGLYNDGINIKAKNGDNVKATEDGVVAYVGDELRGYGNLIIVKHSSGWISAYGHLGSAKVKRGNKVKKGETIAIVGTTGNVKSPQLYFGLRKGREAVNPQSYL